MKNVRLFRTPEGNSFFILYFLGFPDFPISGCFVHAKKDLDGGMIDVWQGSRSCVIVEKLSKLSAKDFANHAIRNHDATEQGSILWATYPVYCKGCNHILGFA